MSIAVTFAFINMKLDISITSIAPVKSVIEVFTHTRVRASARAHTPCISRAECNVEKLDRIRKLFVSNFLLQNVHTLIYID
jgi:hypothetical protein